MILPESISRVRARHGRRRLGGIASAVDGTLARNGEYRRLRRVLLARCKREAGRLEGMVGRPMHGRNEADCP